MPSSTIKASADRPPNKLGVALLLLLVALVVSAIRPATKTSMPELKPQQSLASAPEIAPAPAAAPIKPAQPTLASTVRQASEDAQRAIGALGGSGARLYSENCYAALANKPSDATRDRCLAFDLLAARVLSEAGDTSETVWFAEERARERYQKSAMADIGSAEAAIARVSAAIGALPTATAPSQVGSDLKPMQTEADAEPNIAPVGNEVPTDLGEDAPDGDASNLPSAAPFDPDLMF